MSSYNFCPQCGAQLKSDARFCSECGTRLDAYEVDLRAAIGNDASPQVEKTCAPQAAGARETPTECAPAQAVKTPAADAAKPAGEESGAAASSFAAAVESTKHRSHRRVPLVVLVALALALTSAVAFAAYQVYTQVIAPAMQEQQAEGETQQAEEPQEPITYTTRTETMTVAAPGDPMSGSPTLQTAKFSYELLVPSRESDAVDKINAAIEQSVQDTASITSSKAEQQANGSTDEEVVTNICMSRQIYVTYLTDSVVCFFDLSYVYPRTYGAHGGAERGGIAFSLETGEQVSMSSVIGVDQSELIDLTCAAEETYLTANPKTSSTTPSKVLETTRKTLTDNQGKLKKTTPGLEGEERFCLGEDGMYYLTSDYEIGSFAEGTRNICIAGFTDQSVVGTESVGYGFGRGV